MAKIKKISQAKQIVPQAVSGNAQSIGIVAQSNEKNLPEMLKGSP
jgi:hypothetical protein